MIYTDSFKDDMGLPLTRMEVVGSNVYMRNPQVQGSGLLKRRSDWQQAPTPE